MEEDDLDPENEKTHFDGSTMNSPASRQITQRYCNSPDVDTPLLSRTPSDGIERLAAGFPLVPNSMFSHSIMYMSHYIPGLSHTAALASRLQRSGDGELDSRRTPEAQPHLHRPGHGSTQTRAVVFSQHPSLSQPDIKIHRRVELYALPSKIPTAGTKERTVLVQESQSQMQEAENVSLR
jgi:hypothetical protein